MNWIATGAVLAALAVAMGAFGAHALKNRLDAEALQVYHTAVLYHFFHALGILLVTALARTPSLTPQAGDRVAWLLFAGILLFSGSLYALALSGIRVLGVITPLGGLAFIAGWLWLAFEASRRRI